MVSERNRIIELVKYIESFGITVNLCKNKARGNRGFFSKDNKSNFRIDISKLNDDCAILSTLLHEFAHYIHYRNDSSLKSLNFVFGELSDEDMEELLAVTINCVPKHFAQTLLNQKESSNNKISKMAKQLKCFYPDFTISASFTPIEKTLPLCAKYLLKYDKVKFGNKIYSVDLLDEQFNNLSKPQKLYIKLKSQQHFFKRVNNKINRLNKYYNQPSELWARFFELYFIDNNKAKELAPNISKKFNNIMSDNLNELIPLKSILQNCKNL